MPCGVTQACRSSADCLSGICTQGSCGDVDPNRPRATPLMFGDLEGLSVEGFPGFDLGFRCKSLSVCTISQPCFYFQGRLGSRQSSEALYYDGEVVSAAPIKLRVGAGAASQCGNPPVKILSGNWIELVFDGGRRLRVALPSYGGKELQLFVAADGATYWDRDLTSLAARP
jgi:hypothetical protein